MTAPTPRDREIAEAKRLCDEWFALPATTAGPLKLREMIARALAASPAALSARREEKQRALNEVGAIADVLEYEIDASPFVNAATRMAKRVVKELREILAELKEKP